MYAQRRSPLLVSFVLEVWLDPAKIALEDVLY